MPQAQRSPLDGLNKREDAGSLEEFGWSLTQPDGVKLRVDLSLAPLATAAGQRKGFVLTLRDAAERMRSQAIEETLDESHSFDRDRPRRWCSWMETAASCA